jgi:hypothetical protein
MNYTFETYVNPKTNEKAIYEGTLSEKGLREGFGVLTSSKVTYSGEWK